MNGHHHRHHKKEEGNGKYIAGIVLSILVIIAAIVHRGLDDHRRLRRSGRKDRAGACVRPGNRYR